MRHVTSAGLSLSVVLAVGLALGCNDGPTEVPPPRANLGPAHMPVAFATASTGSGATFTTDKDDYSPGDTLRLAGSGWTAGDSLDIHLDESPQNHPPVDWVIGVDENGSFQDSTYVVQELDAGVTFALTATSRTSGESATASFTDGAFSVKTNTSGFTVAISYDVYSNTTCTGSPSSSSTSPSVGNSPATQLLANLANTQSIKLTAPAAAASGARDFVSWSKGSGDSTTTTICVTGTTGTQTWTVTYLIATTTTLQSSLNPSTQGTSVTFTATVTSGSPATAIGAKGAVTFKTGGTSCVNATAVGGAVSLNASGQATFSTSALALGTTTVRACYGGQGQDYEESEGFVDQVVNSGTVNTTTEVVSSKNPSVSGESVTFTATVKSGGTAIGAHGSVSFRQGGSDCSTGTEVQVATALDAGGQATYTNSFNASGGSQIIRACYGGASGYSTSSGFVTQTVNKAATSVALSKSPTGNSVFSESVTFSVTVTVSSPGSGTPTGNVTFEKGGTGCGSGTDLLSTRSLDSDGKAIYATADLAVGTHTIRACYGGDDDFSGSASSISHTVEKASSSVVLTSSVNPSILNQSVTFEATVSPVSPATATPTGSVSFEAGGTACGTGTQLLSTENLDGDGKASFSTSTLSVGKTTVRACYGGSTNFNGSSNSLEQQVTYNWDGVLLPPVDRPNTYNVSKAGQAIPLKWRLTDYNGAAVITLTSVTVSVKTYTCPTGPATTDQIEEYATGASGLQNLGDGYYQFNWKSPSSYAGSCKKLAMDLSEGAARDNLALFTFKK